MRPLIFEYAEYPVDENIDTSLVEYSNSLHLNVIKGTQTPAVDFVSFDTETFTKAEVDTGEADNDLRTKIVCLMDTQYETRSLVDSTEGDK